MLLSHDPTTTNTVASTTVPILATSATTTGSTTNGSTPAIPSDADATMAVVVQLVEALKTVTILCNAQSIYQ